MSILKLARTAAAAAALAALPVHAVAAAPSALPALAAGAVVQDNAIIDGDEGHPFFRAEYLIPTAIVVLLGLVLYFALEDGDGDEDPGPGVSP